MNEYFVRYRHRHQHSLIVGYIVVCEDLNLADQVGLEHIENDERPYIDNIPDNWEWLDTDYVERCTGCGGSRIKGAKPGTGVINP